MVSMDILNIRRIVTDIFTGPVCRYKTRLSSIESQPKKVVVVVVVVVVVGGVVVAIVGHRNLTLKFGQNWVSIKSNIVVVIVSVFLGAKAPL